MVSDSIPANKGKDERFVIEYHDQDGNLSPLLIKNPKKIYSQGVSQYSQNSAFTMAFDLGDYPEWLSKYDEILKKVEWESGAYFTNIGVKKDCYINPKLKEWEGKIRTNLHKKKIPKESFECTEIIKIGSIYKQGSNYYIQTYLEECKYKEVERYGASYLSESEDEEGYNRPSIKVVD